MKKIILTKLTISQDEINKLDKKSKKRFIMFACMIRDLNLLNKCLIYINNGEANSEPGKSANGIAMFFFLKNLVSKIHEMKSFLDKNNISDEYIKFPEKLKIKYDGIEKYFSDNKVKEILSFIRDKFGHHYEYQNDVDELIEGAINKMSIFEVWLSPKDSGNELFLFSGNIMLKVIFDKMIKLGFEGDEDKLLNTLFDLCLEGTRLFREFSVFYLAKYFEIKWEEQEEVEIEAPLISDVRLPLIVAR